MTGNLRYVTGPIGHEKLLHHVQDQTGELEKRTVVVGLAQVEKMVREFAEQFAPSGGKYSVEIHPPEYSYDEGDNEDERAWKVVFKRMTLRDQIEFDRKERE